MPPGGSSVTAVLPSPVQAGHRSDHCWQNARMMPRARLVAAVLASGLLLAPLAGCSQDQNQQQNQ